MGQNIGVVNAFIRIFCGLSILTWAAVKMTRRPWYRMYYCFVLCGAMKIASGIVRYCPVTDCYTCFGRNFSIRAMKKQWF